MAPTSVSTGGYPPWLEGTTCGFGIVPKPEPAVLCCTMLSVSWQSWINEWRAYESESTYCIKATPHDPSNLLSQLVPLSDDLAFKYMSP